MPSVHLPSFARPPGPVRISSPARLPPPSVATNLTGTPDTGLPPESVTLTVGSSFTSEPTIPVTDTAETGATLAGALFSPGPAESVHAVAVTRLRARIEKSGVDLFT